MKDHFIPWLTKIEKSYNIKYWKDVDHQNLSNIVGKNVI